MSFRSALTNASPTSGNVGAVISDVATTSTTLTTNVYSTIGSVTLPAGTWSINTCLKNIYGYNTDVTYSSVKISSSTEVFLSTKDNTNVITASFNFINQLSNSVTITLTESTTINCQFGAEFGGTLLSVPPTYNELVSPLNFPYTIQATKLA